MSKVSYWILKSMSLKPSHLISTSCKNCNHLKQKASSNTTFPIEVNILEEWQNLDQRKTA